MRARVWIEQEVEVEVSAEEAIAALMDLEEPERLPMALSGINACYAWLKRVPDTLIAEMTDKHREIISNALAEQLSRYKTPND